MAISLTSDGFNFNGNDPYSTPPVYGATTSGSGGTYLIISPDWSFSFYPHIEFMYDFNIGSGSSVSSGNFGIRMA